MRRCWAAVATRTCIVLCFFVFASLFGLPLPHVSTSLLDFGGAACRICFPSSAHPEIWVGGQFTFLSGRNVIFFQSCFRKHPNNWWMMCSPPIDDATSRPLAARKAMQNATTSYYCLSATYDHPTQSLTFPPPPPPTERPPPNDAVKHANDCVS